MRVTDGTPNTTVTISDSDGLQSKAYTLDAGGNLTQKLPDSIGWGQKVLVKFSDQDQPFEVPTGRTAAVTDLHVARNASGKLVLSGKAPGGANVYVGASRVQSESLQNVKAATSGAFSMELNDKASRLAEGYVYAWTQGVRTRIKISDLFAQVKDIDLEAGTAHLDGFAPATATGVDVSWVDKNGKTKEHSPKIADSGAFEDVVTDLPLGETVIHVTAFDGGTEIAQYDVTVDLHVAPLTADSRFSSDLMENVTVFGDAQPNSSVRIKNGKTDVKTVPVDDNGHWETTLNAPNRAGEYALTVHEIVRGEDYAHSDLTIDYGKGVSITSPDDGFEVDPGQSLTIKGDAQDKSGVKVYEKGKPQNILGANQAGTSNTYRIVTSELEDREYQLVVEGISKGYNRTRAEITVNPGKSSVAKPTAEVEFPEDVTKKAIVKGTGVTGGMITVKDEKGKTVGGPVSVEGAQAGTGSWSTEIDPLGPGTHTLKVEQSGIDGVQETTVDADFGPAVAAAGPAAPFEGSSTTITGTGTDRARIVISENEKEVASGTVEHGAFSIPVERIQDGTHTYTVTQTAPGNTVSSTEVTAVRDAAVVPVTVTSPKSGDTHAPNSVVRFEGTGTPGAKVVVHAGEGLTDFDATVDPLGNWHVDRPVTTGTWIFDVIQTAKGGNVSRVDGIELPEAGVPVDRPFDVTAPTSGSTHKDELVTFEGTGTPESTVTIDPKNPNLAKVTATVGIDGHWSVNRWIGGGKYEFDVIQSKDSTETGRKTVRINQSAEAVKPFAVTSPDDGATVKDQLVTFRGTGAAGSTVTLDPNNPYLATLTAPVGNDGEWSIDRWIGSGQYTFTVTQTTDEVETGRVTMHLNQPAEVTKPFAVTSPDNLSSHQNELVTFRGTGKAGSTITLDPNNPSLATVTAKVKDNGDWEVSRWLGAGSYHFTVTQTTDDTADGSVDLDLNPAATR
ncbi:Ig-like domain-containing protein [Curtobacterium sp. BRD11]|uniref:Ig-like domain-containing protein n=1 Tax=Curtobacterium sp. BRD11 TaxID=2962581 RepID=UPI002881F5E4|nr:Ig-like domain-containing protein [Curtobacterium sp. BRD11]MDT0211550.1 Ig-like domain-containing protein [Curtobacterium sp. BRD11]